ncbi:DNA topoisomerase IB [Peteryoungia desertarenae]|uniref:DNA topoisomerase IB n=1 Tax=Peteryoungia desertarenae TaxID=1813451 RepID=UPI003CCD3E60
MLKPDLASLRQMGLIYVTDTMPGITRRRCGKGFAYRWPDGARLDDHATLARIRNLGLPPAYEQVWICLDPKGHLQATGLDAKGRKQYRYHPDWAAWRSQQKFDQLLPFGRKLPVIRRHVLEDLKGDGDLQTFLLATLVILLDVTHMRVGNRSYAEENKTFGATTLLKRHLHFDEDAIRISFTAKGGKRVRRTLRHPRLQRVLEEISDLPGRDLFSWKDSGGTLHRIDSGRLNQYLSETSGNHVSAKTFRTWGGSVAALAAAGKALRAGEKITVKLMCQAAAETLHNTPAICRNSYVHPHILKLASDDDAAERLVLVDQPDKISGLRRDEDRLMAFLQQASVRDEQT